MRAILTIGGEYPETMRSTLEELASNAVKGLTHEDVVDMLESADDDRRLAARCR